MVAPPNTHILRDGLNRAQITRLSASRQAKFKFLILGSRPSQEAGVEFLKGCRRRVNTFGNQPEIDWIIDFHSVVCDRFLGFKLIQPVLGRILGHDGDGHDNRYVIAGFFGQDISPVKFPEIRVSGAPDRLLDGARAGVVRRHGQIPVPKLVV